MEIVSSEINGQKKIYVSNQKDAKVADASKVSLLSSSAPNVSIIILNWNGWDDTIECLESLYQITYPSYDVIVVDNGSEDESIKKIKEYCEGNIELKSKFFEYSTKNKPIKILEYTKEDVEAGGGKEKEINDLPSDRKLILIKNDKNYGFTKGNNIGIKFSMDVLHCDYVLLLNNDTIINEKKFLDDLANHLNENLNTSAVGPRIFNLDGTVQKSFWRFHSPKKVFFENIFFNFPRNFYNYHDNNKPKNVDVVLGACILFRKEIFEKIGLLDENIFMYTDETDICFRIKQKGNDVDFLPSCSIIHLGGKSSRKTSKTALINSYKSKIYFLNKHFDKKESRLMKIFLIIGLYERFFLYFFINLLSFGKIKGKVDVFRQTINWYKNKKLEIFK